MDNVGDFCLATGQQRPPPTNFFYLGAATTCLLERARSVTLCICTRHSFTSRPKGVVFNWLDHCWRDGPAQGESYVQLLYPDFPMGTNKHSQTCTLLSTFHDSLMYCVFVLFFFFSCTLCCQFLWIVFVLFFFVSCTLCCQFLWIVFVLFFFFSCTLCCQFLWIVFVLFFFFSCALCCQFLCIVYFWAP